MSNKSPSLQASFIRSDLFQSVLAFAVRLGTGLASYLLFAAVARASGPVEFGTFSICFSAAMLIGTAGSFGQQVFLVKEVPRAQELSDQHLETGAYAFSYAITLLFGTVGALAYLGLAPLLGEAVAAATMASGAALCFLFALSQTTMGALRVQGRTLLAMTSRDLVWRTGSILIIVALATAAGWGQLSAASVLIAMSFSLAPVVLLHLFLIVPPLVTGLQRNRPHWRIIPWLETSLGLAIVGVISSADLYAYTIALGFLMPPEATGAFFAALKTVELINLFLMAVTLIVSPAISRLIAKRDPVSLQKQCNSAIILQGTPAILASIIMLIGAPLFMWFFDPDFVASSDLLRLLVLGMLLNALTGATVLLLQLGGMHWKQVLYQGGSLLFSLALLPLLITYFGIYGAALSFIVSKVLWNVLALVAIRQKLDVDPSILGLLDARAGGLRQAVRDIAQQLKAPR